MSVDSRAPERQRNCRIPVSRFALDEKHGQQRNHDLVVAGNGMAFASRSGMGAVDDVRFGAVVLKKIEVDRGEFTNGITEVADR